MKLKQFLNPTISLTMRVFSLVDEDNLSIDEKDKSESERNQSQRYASNGDDGPISKGEEEHLMARMFSQMIGDMYKPCRDGNVLLC